MELLSNVTLSFLELAEKQLSTSYVFTIKLKYTKPTYFPECWKLTFMFSHLVSLQHTDQFLNYCLSHLVLHRPKADPEIC